MTLLIYDDDSNVFLVYEMLFVKFIYELYFFYSLVCLSTVAIVFLLSGTLLFWSAASIWFLFYCICLLYWCAASLLVCCIYLVFVLLHLSVILFCYISFGRLHLFSLLHLFGFCSTASVCCIYLVFVLLHLKCGIILISFHSVW
jgi:hypothetical protein